MKNLTVDYDQPYCDGAYIMKALQHPELQWEQKNEMDVLYINAMRELSDGRIEKGLNGLKTAYEMGDLETGVVLAYGYGQVCPEVSRLWGTVWKASGGTAPKAMQKKSLLWIREQRLSPCCVESIANHDPDVKPHIIEL